jgi:general L-amino acid transport system permease protein
VAVELVTNPARPAKRLPPPVKSRSLSGRSLFWQVFAVACFVAFVAWVGQNAANNMAKRSITFGFDFLLRPAGFDIPFHLLSWDVNDSYGWALAVTFGNSLLAAVLSVVLASALGLLLALMRLSGNPLAAGTSRAVMELVRNTPQLVQIIFIYFLLLQALPPPRQSLQLGLGIVLNVRGLLVPEPSISPFMFFIGLIVLCLVVVGWLGRQPGRVAGLVLPPVLLLAWLAAAGWSADWLQPQLKGFNYVGGFRLPPELLALWLGISIYTSAFISEIIRASILGLPHGQTEAALSLGLNRWQAMFLVILPQALRTLIPPLTSQYLNIIKSTTLGAAIAYPDVLQIFGRTVLNQSGRAVEVMSLLLGLFLIINLMTSAAMNRWNRKLALQGLR